MILKLKSGKYIHVESYGISSWGTLRQTNIEKDFNNDWWVITSQCVDPINDKWDITHTKLQVEEVLLELPKNQILYNQEEYDIFTEFFIDIKNKGE